MNISREHYLRPTRLLLVRGPADDVVCLIRTGDGNELNFFLLERSDEIGLKAVHRLQIHA